MTRAPQGAADTSTPAPLAGVAMIDVHTHALDPELPNLTALDPRVPSVTTMPDGRIQVSFDGRPYRVMDRRAWSPEARLVDMDALGVHTQVVSPFPISFCHDIAAPAAVTLARHQNDFFASLVGHPSGRFAALGAVPLQDSAAAVSELTRCVSDLGFLGVAIGTEVAGKRLSDASMEPFWSAAHEARAVVLIHPVDHCTDPRIRDGGLTFGLGMPTETAFAALNLLLSDTLQKYNQVRICLAHGGGSLASVLPRAAFGQSLGIGPGSETEPLSVSARRLWVDSLTYDPAVLELIARTVGADHVVFGTDYPAAPPAELVESLLETDLGGSFTDAIVSSNVVELLGERLRPTANQHRR